MAEPTDKPRRRWLQIHLSTAIVLMVVAGILMWMNIGPLQELTVDHLIRPASNIEKKENWTPVRREVRFLGWPLRFYYGTPWTHHFPSGEETVTTYLSFETWPLVLDCIFLCGVLCGSATVCEVLVRRREARAP